MKAIASLALSIALAISALIPTAGLVSLIWAEPAVSSGLTAIPGPDLWTAAPVRVDRNKQTFERLPAVYPTYVTNPVPVKLATGGSIGRAPKFAASRSTAQHDLCSKRYRSYDPANNSARSHDGQRRPCVSPYPTQQDIDKNRIARVNPRFVGYGEDNLRIASCAARYQSYRASDNTYQPYDGPRRQCLPSSRGARLEASNRAQDNTVH